MRNSSFHGALHSLVHLALHVAVAQPRRLRHRRANVPGPIQDKIPAHCDVAKALRKRRQLIGLQVKIPAHCDIPKALRKRRQLIVIQVKTPAHCDVAKALRKRRQLIVMQVKIPGGANGAKLVGQRSQLTLIQVPVLKRPVGIEVQALPDLGFVGARTAAEHGWDEHVQRLLVLPCIPQREERLQHSEPSGLNQGYGYY